ncbi:hypothetical protein F5148DRAFT_523131 [Russula earlei]|uniref:Uncharacterized protein n=1 Tax=Russula earlei TaxID=71964 RepID=A0ACC0UG74_9AGAM|nr:hypothetical protein F5148DRAFT_523131 [Russula earlei]
MLFIFFFSVNATEDDCHLPGHLRRWPNRAHNCSSLVLDIVGDGSLWMIDCAEGNLRQFSLQPQEDAESVPEASHVNKIFVTHMRCQSVIICVPNSPVLHLLLRSRTWLLAIDA